MSGPNPAGGFDTKYMIWGLVRATRYMKYGNDFRNYKFRLRWKNVVVAFVSFDYQQPTIGMAGADASMENTFAAGNSSKAAGRTKSTQGIPDIGVKLDWSKPTVPLSFNDVMMTIIGGYADVAVHGMDDFQEQTRLVTSMPPYAAELVLRLARYSGNV